MAGQRVIRQYDDSRDVHQRSAQVPRTLQPHLHDAAQHSGQAAHTRRLLGLFG